MATISLAILAIISIIITGGDCTDAAMATFNQFPYMASLRKIENHDEPTVSEHFCGGAIISDRWVLTAAHCTSKPHVIEPKDLVVVTGTRHISQGGSHYETEQIINHELYYEAREPLRFDISLIKTKIPIQFNLLVHPIALRKDWIHGDEAAVISGFKCQYDNVSEFMKYYYVKTVENNQCNNRIDPNLSTLLSQNTLCATHTSDVSFGSTGGPLVTKDNKMIGIASWSTRNRNGRSDQFTRISVFADWIAHHTQVVAS